MLVSSLACGGAEESKPNANITSIPTPISIVTMSYEEAMSAIQVAIISFDSGYEDWPITDGQSGDIEWAKLVPDFIVGIPSNDHKCEWWVNSDPEGDVCLQNIC